MHQQMETRTTYSTYLYAEVCVWCDKQMKNRSKYYGGGVCPNCGRCSGHTVCDLKNIVWRNKMTHVLTPVKLFGVRLYDSWVLQTQEREYKK